MTTLAEEVRKVGNEVVSYDMSFHNALAFYSYQYLLPHTVFDRFASERGEEPRSATVISGAKWQDATRLNAWAVARERGINLILWRLSGAGSNRSAGESPGVKRRLGAEKVPGVEEQGFYGQQGRADKPLRWTNGAAKLVVPVEASRLPARLRVELAWTGPKGTRLQIRVNGRGLYHEHVSSGEWTKTFALTGVKGGEPVIIELLSDTFVPKETLPGSVDTRTLGVAVRGIWLLDGDRAMGR
jgi:hypothetical protein